MSSKRNCIFTGKEADFSMKVVGSRDKHNWAKSVPCTKEFFDSLDGRPLNKYEFKLVELFYEQEISKLNIARLEEKMTCVRDLAKKRAREDRLDERVGISDQLGLYEPGEEVIKHISELDIPIVENPDLSDFEEIREVDTIIMKDSDGEKREFIVEEFPEPPKFEDKHIKKFLEDKKVTEENKDDTIKKVVKKKKNNLWG